MPLIAKAPASAVGTEQQALQGVWNSVAGPRDARLLIAGNRFTFEFVGGDLYMGTIGLEPGNLGQMDLQIEAGPEEHVGQVSLCIYQLESGVLRWCPGRPGSNRRLTTFPSVDDPRYLSFVFRHSKRRFS